MKLSYRGATYASVTTAVGLQNSNPTTTDLSYRGNRYRTNQPVVTDVKDAPER
ncbi:MAG: DUF4278 domain-containing protein [Kaiparowitsia implicata GSE-PSE-MK54-09C]|jgi:hypothetical protein|nr:DUF4278 domain-containing protein [Kaiparowitsia implicata GSE-PSE-MK54-09C]